MQLGKTIVGGILGAALGIGLLVAVFLLFQIDKVWLAIPVAILTGLGVRLMVSTSGQASYVRGAVTGLLALVAYLAGWWIAGQIATRSAAAQSLAGVRVAPAAPVDAEAEAEDAEAEAAQPAPAPVAVPQPVGRGTVQKPAMARNFSTMDFLWLCVAALVAYELGRGTAGPSGETVEERSVQDDEVPAGTHPDA